MAVMIVRHWECMLELSECRPNAPHISSGCGWTLDAIQCDKCGNRLLIDSPNWYWFAIKHLGWHLFRNGKIARCPVHRCDSGQTDSTGSSP